MTKAEERTAYSWVRASGCRTSARAGLGGVIGARSHPDSRAGAEEPPWVPTSWLVAEMDENKEGAMTALSRHSSVAGGSRAAMSGSSTAVLGVREQERMPMKIVERLAIIADRRAEKTAPERVSVFPSRAQALMLLIGDLPKLVKTQFRNDLGNFSGHPDQEGGKADVYPGRVPRNSQRVSCHLHANDPREYSSAEIHAIRKLPTLCSLPPINISELKVGEDERAPARSETRPCFHRAPKASVNPQDIGNFPRISPLGRARKTLQVPIIELMDEFEARPANPRGRCDREWRFRIFLLPGSFGHFCSPESEVSNLLLRRHERTSNSLRLFANIRC